MKQASIYRVEKLMTVALAELEKLRQKPVLTKDETRKLVRKQYTAFTKLIQKRYEEEGDTFEKLAKKLDVTPAYARNIVFSDRAHISNNILKSISKVYKIPFTRLSRLAVEQRKISDRYRKSCRKSA